MVWLVPDDRVKLAGVTVAVGLVDVLKVKVWLDVEGLACLVSLMKPWTMTPDTKPPPFSMHFELVLAVKFAGVHVDDAALSHATA